MAFLSLILHKYVSHWHHVLQLLQPVPPPPPQTVSTVFLLKMVCCHPNFKFKANPPPNPPMKKDCKQWINLFVNSSLNSIDYLKIFEDPNLWNCLSIKFKISVSICYLYWISWYYWIIAKHGKHKLYTPLLYLIPIQLHKNRSLQAI